MFFKKDILNTFEIVTGKHPCCSLFFIKLHDLTFSDGIGIEHWPEMS